MTDRTIGAGDHVEQVNTAGTVRSINPDGLITPDGPFAHAVVANGFVFIAGQTALGPDGTLGDERDIVAQTRRTLDNVERALKAAGSSLNDVVKLVWYLTDIEDRPAVARVRSEYLTPPYPASTLVEVSGLAGSDLRIEIDAIAVLNQEAVNE